MNLCKEIEEDLAHNLAQRICSLEMQTLNDEYSNFLKGKNIIVVGPAETVKGKGLGNKIDNYDVVVRISTQYEYMPFDNNIAMDYGTRCDVLYLHHGLIKFCIIKERNVPTSQFVNFCKVTGVKFIVLANQENTFSQDYIPASDCHPTTRSVCNDFIKLMNQNDIDAKFIVIDELSRLARVITKQRHFGTGFQAFLDILSYPIDVVNVIGMTLYHGGGHIFHKGYDCKNLTPDKDFKGKPMYVNTRADLEMMKILIKYSGKRLTYDDGMDRVIRNGQL